MCGTAIHGTRGGVKMEKKLKKLFPLSLNIVELRYDSIRLEDKSNISIESLACLQGDINYVIISGRNTKQKINVTHNFNL